MNTPSPARPVPRPTLSRRPPLGWSYRLSVASRLVAAVVGGYALAAFFTTTVALLAPTPREEAAYLAGVPSFLVFAAAIVWSFATRTAARAWLGVALPLAAAAFATWWLTRGS